VATETSAKRATSRIVEERLLEPRFMPF
jgi:hypothetical protein